MENKKFLGYYTISYSHSGFQNGNLEIFPVYGMKQEIFPVYASEPKKFPVYGKEIGIFPVYVMKSGNFSSLRNKNLNFVPDFRNRVQEIRRKQISRIIPFPKLIFFPDENEINLIFNEFKVA